MAGGTGLSGGINMLTDHFTQPSEQAALEIFDTPVRNRPMRQLRRRLNQVLLGKRPALRVYSKTLQTDFWFVNEGLADPADRRFSGKVVTMEMLVEIMSSGRPLLASIRGLLNASH
jgi:hypothetical protein